MEKPAKQCAIGFCPMEKPTKQCAIGFCPMEKPTSKTPPPVLFADVILPLPLDALFTYAVPTRLQTTVGERCRVLVPFGRSKRYIALVARLHDKQPEGYQVKELLEVIDDKPILLPQQLQLWQWIADYYMSPIGEVYKAALPAGLKAIEGYRPKTETHLRLAPPFCSEQGVAIALDMLQQARAYKQLQLFRTFLDNSFPPTEKPGNSATSIPASTHEVRAVRFSRTESPLTRDELLNLSHATTATLKALIDRGILETFEVEVGRLNSQGEPHPENIKPLTMPQQEAYNQLLLSMMRRQVTLLHGVTASGKTEIYINLIQREIDRGRQVLYLLPEIALTVQIMERLRRVFGSRLGIYHSRYSDAERVEIWQKQLSPAPYDIILGARSAVMLPFQKLSLVIVDEEHETSYKQQDPAPRYHARSVAIMMAARAKAHVVLGTATPSMETYHNAISGKYGLVTLTQRHQGVQLPEIQVVDTRDLQRRKMMNGPFSPLLLAKLREALDQGEQAILFQNRRGYAPQVECKQCGWVPHCQHCDVALTLHRQTGMLTCHYCGYTYHVPHECPACSGNELRTRGYGTEKLEDLVADLLPQARIARMDLDTTRTSGAYERLIADFASGATNLLIGTQMISKGLDFDRVSVVGIVNADAMLNQPDFRAYEHAYMMMAQVGGRAGRRNKRGLVILQTKNPELPIISQIVNADYTALYNTLAAERQAFGYPPFRRLIYIYIKHRSDQLAESAAQQMGNTLRQWFGARLLGPDKPSVARVKSLSIRKLVLKVEPQLNLADVRRHLLLAQQQLMHDKRFASIQLYYDVDPL